ncbi:MAG: YajQ family cyclic di-GMP-binding protein [Armatimonadetes bacterium]|nr:YajQ family cyclic di-GMP-binding protein [Armatimonadota bacterium]
MSGEFSFDIVSEVDKMEVKNAFNQAEKELQNRYDFKGTKAEMELADDSAIDLTADDEFRMGQLYDIVFSKLIKRNIDAKMIETGKIEAAGGMTVKQKVSFKQGIPQDQAKALVKQIKDSKIKVNAQIQGEQVRVSSKSKDDLQKTMQFVKGLDLPYAINFTNYR